MYLFSFLSLMLNLSARLDHKSDITWYLIWAVLWARWILTNRNPPVTAKTYPRHLLYSSRLINRMVHGIDTNSSTAGSWASHRNSNKSRRAGKSTGALVVKAPLLLTKATSQPSSSAPWSPAVLLSCWDTDIPVTAFLFFTKKKMRTG